jgi:Mn2+/Fe2+ NRAMP family transporter
MFASNAIMYFIILATAATLHANGQTTTVSASEAADALRPLAGAGAHWLFTLGLIGTGLLAVPVLAGSCAYAITEALAWDGLDRPPGRAGKFYADSWVGDNTRRRAHLCGRQPDQAVFASAVLNGVLAPPLILLVLLLTRDRTVMGKATNPRLVDVLGWTTFGFMVAAALGLFFAS